MIRISIILPVYNVEDWISDCIESLKKQALDGLEFIFVDDCGTDNSMKAVEAWAMEDERVRIIRNPKNIGSGPSRNLGIEAAQGEYLSFIDPDDYLSPDFYTILYAAANQDQKHDIAKGSRCKVDENCGIKVEKRLNNKIRNYLSKGIPLYGSFTYEHQTALYHKSLFADGSARYGVFPNAEDTTFLLRCCYQTNDIVIDESAVYYYVQHENSAASTPNTSRILFEIDSLSEKFDFLISKGLDDSAVKYLLMQARTCIKRYQLLLGSGLVSRNEYMEIAKHLSKLLKRIPGIDAIPKKHQLQEILSDCPLTTAGKRYPGEGTIRVSVVLPVFNPGPGIQKCIESLRAQLLDGLEFIFVDDCSTDESMSAVERWASDDNRVHIIRNERNLGAGPSRNRGIEYASGDYLSFVDPDDFISLDFYELLYSAAIEDGGHDISKGCVETVSESYEIIEKPSRKLNKRIQSQLPKGRPLWRLFTGEHFSAIYQRKLFVEGDAKYGTSKHCEDITFLLYACYGTNDIVFSNNAIYAYVQRQSSLSHIISPARYESDLDAFEEGLAFLMSKGPLGKTEYAYLSSKLAYRYQAYRRNMKASEDLKNHYPIFAARVREIKNSTPNPNQMRNSSRDLEGLFTIRHRIKAFLQNKKNTSTTTVSVILPVYNVEPWIDECIESLKKQKLPGLEFIFVDDCGSDNSMAAVETWAKEDERVRIIRNPQNLGSGPSRNEGIKAAKGKYLSFVDPDDLIADNFYELLYTAAKKGRGHDIAKGSVCHVPDPFDETKAYPAEDWQNNRIKTRLPERVPLYRLFTYEHWTAIYKRSLVLSGNCLYGSSCTAQDTTFQLRVCLLTNDIVLEERALYYYRQRGNSATNNDALRRTYGELDALDEKIDILLERDMDKHALLYIRETAKLVLRRFQDVLGKGLVSHSECPQILKRLIVSLPRVPELEGILKMSKETRTILCNTDIFLQNSDADNESKPKISVIIPFFNHSDGLEKCIYSLRQQLMGGLEFIFIDDCSTDGSVEVVNEWATKDSRVRIIQNETSIGYGASISIGIESARGKYLSFINPEDYVSPNFFELLYAKATEGRNHDIAKGRCEIIESGFHRETPLWQSSDHKHLAALYRQAIFREKILQYAMDGAPNDLEFLTRMDPTTKSIVYETDAIYHYKQISESDAKQ